VDALDDLSQSHAPGAGHPLISRVPTAQGGIGYFHDAGCKPEVHALNRSNMAVQV